MNFNLTSTPEEEKFRQEISDFLDRELTEDLRRQHALDQGLGPQARAFARKIGADGYAPNATGAVRLAHSLVSSSSRGIGAAPRP